ncbi:hypothetical protein [Saccharopolyspora spinosa]|uniref:hypothetical protein n=1 Tax=Saccharopolyspora spinosa TaxID=60894 RepID=UPI0002379EAA|nr:hypothetical protein [Saccharopolyspora spinosa]
MLGLSGDVTFADERAVAVDGVLAADVDRGRTGRHDRHTADRGRAHEDFGAKQ